MRARRSSGVVRALGSLGGGGGGGAPQIRILGNYGALLLLLLL